MAHKVIDSSKNGFLEFRLPNASIYSILNFRFFQIKKKNDLI